MTATQSDRVFDALRSDILACRIAPASKIRIGSICTRFGVSLGAAREALSRLISDGLVRSTPQKGFSVSPLRLDELHDLTEARIAIETLCLQAALTAGDVEWEVSVIAAIHRLSRIRPRGERPDELNPAWSEAHAVFHAALVSACPNTVLLRLRQELYAESERYRYWFLPLAPGGPDRDVATEHRALADACIARDVAAAGELIGSHYRKTADILARSPAAHDTRSRLDDPEDEASAA